MPILNNKIIETFIVLSVLLLGIYFHFHNLENPGFWGDEETSSMPAKALAMGNGPTFPSGMEYRRALPLTYLNALSAKVFGINKDFSYRVPSALFGIATLVLIFFGTMRFFGLPIALMVTALLAFSEWHIIISRTARMYGPLLFFSISFCFAALTWHQNTKKYFYLAISCILFLTASIFNYLAIVVLPILFIPIIFQDFNKRTFTISLASTVILGIVSTVYFKTFINAPYKAIQSSSLLQATPADNPNSTIISSIINLHLIDYLFISIGLVLGGYTFFKLKKYILSKNHPLISISCFLAIIALYLFILYGKVYGVLICSAFILIFLASSPDKDRTISIKFITIIALIISLIISINIFNHGL
ncbi:MAG: glycosyltransferase family 39 protein, partial [Alcanivoracaceae bacterium]|nr:glycosyltransferase family 39 protein [Alcanivoracaceae bacterium]